jgi:cyclopropane-fatty-acyl-phospholipid synthase
MEAIEGNAPATRQRQVRTPAAARGRPWRRWCARLVHAYLSRIERGYITLEGPGDTTVSFGDPAAGLRARVTVHDPRFYSRTIVGGDLGFAESYMDGDWDCDDLTTLIRIFAVNREALDDLTLATAIPRRLLNRLYHLSRRNTLAGNRRNIQDHYDLGNEFFRLFLDPSMTYSCAVFPTGTETLEEAQRLKIQTMIDKADIRPGDHVLEIGSGWGSLAIEAARQSACRITTLTLSDEQKRWVERRVAEAGLLDRISVQTTDYRQVDGAFDRIVSVEMLEAVGHENLETYFAACDRLLRPGGRAVIQVITIRDEQYAEYRQGCDFIQRYIFPGGHLPCWEALAEAVATGSGLAIDNVEDIGHHYARTLSEWRRAFNANADRVLELGFETSFLRKWNYYFSYCEAGFRSRMLGDLQFILTK